MSDTAVINSQAAGRYALALLDLAEESKSLKSVEKSVKALKSMIAGSGDIQAMIASPVFATDDKVAALTALAAKAKLHKDVGNFVGLVAKNHRAAELPSIIDAFEKLVAKKRGTSSAVVTSAKKLTPAQLKSLKANLKKSIGKDVVIETKVDADLLGGFIVKIGSRLYDSSLKTKLDGLKLAMKEV
ncbi:MAG: F0F1 ATP synthase subunit delta [Robiginitomaculum sp.]